MNDRPDLDPLPPTAPDVARFVRDRPRGLRVRCRVCGVVGGFIPGSPWMVQHRGAHVPCPDCGRPFINAQAITTHRRTCRGQA